MNRVFEVSNENILILKDKILELYNVQKKDIPYGISYVFLLNGSNIIVNVYDKEKNGKRKVMLQGKDEQNIDEIAKLFKQESLDNKSIAAYDYTETRIGIDESGKGDYFGPLVVGGVLIDAKDIEYLERLGVCDSKKLSDKKIIELYTDFAGKITNTVVIISPIKYNEMYEKLSNINKILAWGHSRVAENLLEQDKKKCSLIVIDKFAKHDSRVSNILMERARKCRLIQVHRGERDVAVATASIVARANFVFQMEKMRDKYKLDFAFGVNDVVKDQKIRFVGKYSIKKLNEVAKLHFKLK